jgi:hypothetical protein
LPDLTETAVQGAIPTESYGNFGLIDGSGGAEAGAGIKRIWSRTASVAATRRM